MNILNICGWYSFAIEKNLYGEFTWTFVGKFINKWKILAVRWSLARTCQDLAYSEGLHQAEEIPRNYLSAPVEYRTLQKENVTLW